MKLLRSGRRGASAIEFAMLFPVFVLMASGVVDFGWFLHRQSILQAAVRDATRTGVTTSVYASPGPAGVASARALVLLDDLSFDTSQAAVDTELSNVRTGTTCDTVDTLTVTVTAPFQAMVGLVPLPDDIGAEMTMMIEDSDCLTSS